MESYGSRVACYRTRRFCDPYLVSTEFFDYTTNNDEDESCYPVTPITYEDCSIKNYGCNVPLPFSTFIEIYNKPKTRYEQLNNNNNEEVLINVQSSVDSCCLPRRTRVSPFTKYCCRPCCYPSSARRRNTSYSITCAPVVCKRSLYKPRKPQLVAEFVDIFDECGPRRLYTRRYGSSSSSSRARRSKNYYFKDFFRSRYFSKSPFYEDSVYYDDYSDNDSYGDQDSYYSSRRRRRVAAPADRHRHRRYYEYDYDSDGDSHASRHRRSRDSKESRHSAERIYSREKDDSSRSYKKYSRVGERERDRDRDHEDSAASKHSVERDDLNRSTRSAIKK